MSNNKKRSELSKSQQLSLYYKVQKLVEQVNSSVLPGRQVTFGTALEVANREIRKNTNGTAEARMYAALRAVSSFASLATKNKVTTASLQNSDFLSVGHPLSTKLHDMDEAALRHARAQWIAADSHIASEAVRSLVASAHSLEPGSIERKHAFARLAAMGPGLVPITAAVDLEPIIAVLGLGLGGNSRAARSARARMQRRDRKGRFAFQGGSWNFSVRFPDGSHRGVTGKVVGQSGVDDVEVEVRDNKYVPNGVYAVPASRGIAAKATIPKSALKGLPDRDVEVDAEQRKYSIDSGSLKRMDSPSAWKKIQSADPATASFMTDDGYRLDVPTNDKGEPDFSGVSRGTLRRAVGNQMIANNIDSWDRAESAALMDQDSYDTYLKSPEGQKALSKGGWGVDVVQEEIGESKFKSAWDSKAPGDRPGPVPPSVQRLVDAENERRAAEDGGPGKPPTTPPGKAPAPASPDEPRREPGGALAPTKSVRLNWQTEDGPVDQEGLDAWTDTFAPGVTAKLMDDGSVRMSGTEDNLRNALDKATDGDYNATDYIMDSAKLESYGQPTAPVTVETPSAKKAIGAPTKELEAPTEEKAPFDVEAMKKAVEGITHEKLVTGPTQYEMVDEVGESAWFSEDDVYDATKDGYRETGAVRSGNRMQKYRRYATPSGGVSDLEGSTLDEKKDSIKKIRGEGNLINFSYNGKNRQVQPGNIYINKKNGETNIVTFDHALGEERTYNVSKMEAPIAKKAKAAEAPRNIEAVSGKEPQSITSTDLQDVVGDVQKAIDGQYPISFEYGGKNRVFRPERMYTNPKTGTTNVVGFSETDGEGRTFIAEKMTPSKAAPAPAPTPAPAPAATEDVIDLNPKEVNKIADIKKFVQDAIDNDQKLRFTYSDKDRVVTPESVWQNGQTGRTNLKATDSDGTSKNFAWDKIVAPTEITSRPPSDDFFPKDLFPVDERAAERDARNNERRQEKLQREREKFQERLDDPGNWEQVPVGIPTTSYEWSYVGPLPDFDEYPELMQDLLTAREEKGIQSAEDSRPMPDFDERAGAPSRPSVAPTGPEQMDKTKPGQQTLFAEPPEISPEIQRLVDAANDLRDTPTENLPAIIEQSIEEKKDVAFDFNDKLRVVTPEEIIENKAGKKQLKGFSKTDNEDRTFTIDKMNKPAPDTNVKVDDIVNMPQDELDRLVDAAWPGGVQSAPEGSQEFRQIKTPASSSVEEMSFDPATGELLIKFKSREGKGGGTYLYPNVNRADVDAIEKADSIGSAVGKFVKGRSFEKFSEKQASDWLASKISAPEMPTIDGNPIEDYLGEEARTQRTLPETRPEVVNTTPQFERRLDFFYDEDGNLNEAGKAYNESREAATEAGDFEDVEVGTFDEEAFDSMFVTPEGAYKPDIFGVYRPKGRTDQLSDDYTDDPEILATEFDLVELGEAASRGIADGTGMGPLQFDRDQEDVPVEAILEAIEKSGIDKGMLLSGLYERIAKEANNEVVLNAVQNATNKIAKAVTDNPNASEGAKLSIQRAAQLNGELGAPGFTDNAEELIRNHDEKNKNILKLARDIEREPERDGEDKFAAAAIINRYLPWAFSEDEEQRDGFRAYWGLLLLADGGDKAPWEVLDDDENFQLKQAQAIADAIGGDIEDGLEMMDQLNDLYGTFTDFVIGRQRIAEGLDDLSAKTPAAALYRLVAELATPNTKELQRYIFVDEDTLAFDTYTVEGAEITFDPRSFTDLDVISEKEGEAFATYNRKRRKLIFRVQPGQIDSFDAHSYSWLPNEKEHIGFGKFKVEKVEKIGRLTYAIDISRAETRPSRAADETPTAPAQQSSPAVPYYGDISGWKKVGEQSGSNEGGVYEDENGRQYYVKKARSQSHAENEALASAFYRFFGMPSSEVGLGTFDTDKDSEPGTYNPSSSSIGSDRIITPMIPGADETLAYYAFDANVTSQLHDGFAIDAWLANYDVMGLDFDNVVVDKNGNAYRIDPGGALMWRAQGKPKTWFGPEVGELNSMRDTNQNYSSGSVFGEMTPEQIVESGRKLLNITPSQIDDIVDATISSPEDREMLKDILKRRRSDVLSQLGIFDATTDPFADRVPLTESIGYEAQDLQPGDVIGDDSFVIERIFRDGDTPKNKVSVQGYFPGHESQRKEWNETTIIPAARGGTIPPKGDKPALHRPKAPRKPSPGAFNGKMAELLKDAKTWEEAAAIIRKTPIVFFDYESTGLPGPEKGGKNNPVQIGGVVVLDGKVDARFSSYMNPEHELSDWSAKNLKQMDGSPVTDEWLATQPSMKEAHEQFLAFVNENVGGDVILGGQYTPFDLEILNRILSENDLSINIVGTIDSKDLAQGSLPKWNSKTKIGASQVSPKDGKRRASNSLGPIAEFLEVQLPDWHRADADAEASWEITDAMLDRAIENPDTTPTTLLNVDGSYAAKQKELADYENDYAKYEADLAEYVAAKAIAAAWNCGGSGLTAAVAPTNGPCSVPDIEKMVREATPLPIGEIDPEGVEGGSTSNPTSMADTQEIDDPKYDGIDTNDPYKDEPFMPTEEQRTILDAILSGDDVVVEALAGTGKTSTLLLAGKRKKKERPTERGVYIAFNKSAQLEAERKFADAGLTNIEVVTNDAIAYRWAPKEVKEKMKRLSKTNPLAYYKKFAEAFGITEFEGKGGETVSLFEATKFFKDVVNKFMISADDEIGQQHFGAAGWNGDVPNWMMAIANNIWADYQDPNGNAKINNTVVTKMWALSKPDLSKIGSGTKYANNFIFFDEAQDINPVSGRVIGEQPLQVVYVGDNNQAIYAFRGGENQLEKVDRAVQRLPLTKSFRFGENIAKEANKWLQLLGTDLRVIGAGSDPGMVVPTGSMLDTTNAILVRTNGGGFAAIADQLGRGRRVGVTKNYKGDLVSLTDTAEYLITGNNKPSQLHEDLAPFKAWSEVKKAIEDDLIDSKKLKIFAEMVDADGIPAIREMIDQLRLVKGSGEISDMSEDDTQADVGDVAPGASGELGKGIKYTITDSAVALSGNTYENKDAIKGTKRFKYNGATKTWDAPFASEADTFELLNELSSALGLKKAETSAADDGKIDVMVTTVHQAKGLEWDYVTAWDDFWGPRVNKETGEVEMPEPTELKIAYVAVTRAKKQIDLGPLDWIDSFVKPEVPAAEEEVSVPTPEPTTEGEDGGGIEVPPAPTPTPAEGGDDNERIIKSVKQAVKDADDILEDYSDRGSKDEKKIKKFREAVKDALYAYDGELYVDAEEKFREAAEFLEDYAEVGAGDLQSLMLQAADAADAIRISKLTPTEAPAPKPALDPEWRPDDVAAPQGSMPTGVAAAPDDVLPDVDAPKTAQQAAEEKNKAFRSDATKAADLQQKFDEFNEAVELVTGEDTSLKTSDRKRVRDAAASVDAIRKALADGSMSEQEALAQLNAILDKFPHLPADSATSIDINFFRDMLEGITDVLTGQYYWRPTGKSLPPLDAVDSTGRPVGYSRDGKTFITPGMRVRDKWGYSGTVEGYNEKDWINVFIRYDIDPRNPADVKKGSWGPGVARKSMNPSTLTVLSPEDDTDPWIDLPTTPASKKLPQDIVDKQKKDWAKLKAVRDYEAAARQAELEGREVPPMPAGLALMKPSADLVRDSKKTKANISSYFDDSYDDQDIADATNDFSLSKTEQIVASDAVITTTDSNGTPMVLMISRKHGPFKGAHALPGGFRDGGESFEAAADREMMEEVGISADQATSRRYLGEVDSNDWDPRAYQGAYVGAVAYEVPMDTPLAAGDDATGAEWVSIPDIIKGTTPVAFGHATWLAEAYKGTKYEAPLRALVKASKERNARLINQINAIREQKGFPTFDVPSLEVWTPIYPEGGGEQGGDLPKADAPSGAPVVEAPTTQLSEDTATNSEKVAAIKSAEKSQKKLSTHKRLVEDYKSQGEPAKEFIDAIGAYQSESAGVNLTAIQMISPNPVPTEDAEYVAIATDITDAINKIEPLKDDVFLYRSISGSVGNMVNGLNEGDEFVNNGFSSTSLDKGKALFILNIADENKGLLKMIAPAGTRGAYVDAVNDEKYEFEFLLQRGTKFRVVEKGKEKHEYLGQIPVTFVEIVSQDPLPMASAPGIDANAEQAADVGDEVANPSSEQNALANRVPPKEVLLELIKSGSTDKNARLNESWANYMAQYDGNAPGAAYMKKLTNYLASLGREPLDLGDDDVVSALLDMKLLYDVNPEAEDPLERYQASPTLGYLVYGILAFTSGVYFTTGNPDSIQVQINNMRQSGFIADTGYFDSPAATIGLPEGYETLEDFWENFAKVLENPSVLTDIEGNESLVTGPVGILMRALRDADPLEGSYTRLLAFKAPIEDPTHPLNYLLEDNAYITIRPSSWSHDNDPIGADQTLEGLSTRGLFEYGSFGQQTVSGNARKGDVMITIESPRGLNARPVPNQRGEREVILSNGRYRVKRIDEKKLTDTGIAYTHITLVDESLEQTQDQAQDSDKTRRQEGDGRFEYAIGKRWWDFFVERKGMQEVKNAFESWDPDFYVVPDAKGPMNTVTVRLNEKEYNAMYENLTDYRKAYNGADADTKIVFSDVYKSLLVTQSSLELLDSPANRAEFEPDNSDETVATLGNNVATPDLRKEGRGAAPDGMPNNKELIEMFLDGLENPASEFVSRWAAGFAKYEQGSDPEAESLADALNGDLSYSKFGDLAVDNEFAQNLYAGVTVFTSTYAAGAKTQQGMPDLRRDWTLYASPTKIKDTKISAVSFWYDMARYLYNPDLLDGPITPASAFLRTVRAAKPLDKTFERFLKFDELPVWEEDHPFYGLQEGQEIELRPASWTLEGQLSNVPMVHDGRTVGAPDDEDARNRSRNDGHVVLRVSGVPALNISELSQVQDEVEHVVANGKYVVVSREEVFDDDIGYPNAFTRYVRITLEPVEPTEGGEEESQEQSKPEYSRENYDPTNKDTWPAAFTSDEGIQDPKEVYDILEDVAMLAIQGDVVNDRTPEAMQKMEAVGALLRGLTEAVERGAATFMKESKAAQNNSAASDMRMNFLKEIPRIFGEGGNFYTRYRNLINNLGAYGGARDERESDGDFKDWYSMQTAATEENRKNLINSGYEKARAGLFSGEDDITPAGRAPVKLEKPLPLTSSGVLGIPSLSEAIDSVRDKKKDNDVLGASALVDGIDIEDLDVHANVIYDEDDKEKKLRLRFKLTPWAMLRKENELQAQLQGPGATWSQQAATISSAKLQRNGEILVSDKGKLQFSRGNAYVYSKEDTGGVADIRITSAQVNPGSMMIHNETSIEAPGSLHGQVIIDLPIDASLDDIAEALQLAGVRDVRSATEADLDILAENRLLSLFAQKNDPTENVKSQTSREDLLADIEQRWGVNAQQLVPVIGRHGRIELLLPDMTARKMIEGTATIGFTHDLSVGKVTSQLEKDKYKADYLSSKDPDKVSFENEYGSALVPYKDRVEVVSAAVVDVLKRGLLSTVTRFNEGLQYKGMSETDDLYTGGADYVFLTPTANTLEEYALTRPISSVVSASLYLSAESVMNRSDMYANGYDAFGKRIVGNDALNSAKPGGYETMVRHGLDIVQPGNYFLVEGNVRERALEMLAAEGITQINGIPLEKFLTVNVKSLGENTRKRRGVDATPLVVALEKAGGRFEGSPEMAEVNAMLQLSGSPYGYHYMPPGSKVLASSYSIQGREGYTPDDVEEFEMASLPTLYVMHPDKTLYALEPSDAYSYPEPTIVDSDWMSNILDAVGGGSKSTTMLEILPVTGKAFMSGYGGSSYRWGATATTPAGQKNAGIMRDSGKGPKTFESYTEYIEEMLKDARKQNNKTYAKRQYTEMLGKLLPLFLSDIGGITDESGRTLRSKITKSLLNMRNIVLGADKDTPVVSSANDTPKLLPADYDAFVRDGNYVNVLSGDIVLEDIDGDNAGHIRPVYFVGVRPVLDDSVVTGTYVIVETDRQGRGQYYLDKGTSLVVDPITNEMQFSSHGIKYKIRALQPSDKKKAQERA
jgi:ADP-ribose pyrophosphatase YjhB (NUDIX family)/DNA polymerase III epsilon subunit-like protein/predicted DNA-binding transcriptional regulator YafY